MASSAGQRKLAIFGCTGQTGRKIAELALEQGNTVTALVRSSSRLGDLSGRVDVVEGDVLDPASVDRAVRGADAVLSALGRGKGSPPDFETAALKNITASMGRAGVRRLVVLASSVVSDPADKPTFSQSFTRWLVKAFRRAVYEDSLTKADVIRSSDLDWTIVRASILNNGPATRKYRIGSMEKGAGVRVPRADVAHFILSCATEGRLLRQSPYISA